MTSAEVTSAEVTTAGETSDATSVAVSAPTSPRGPHTVGDVVRTTLRGLGQLLITVGLVILLFCVYELKVTNIVTAREQDRLGDALRQSWAEAPRQATQPAAAPVPAPAAEVGTGIAVMYVPRFGKDWDPKVIVEGVSVDDLKLGPGHIPDTAGAGELGNFVLSGHRTTYGAPFADSDKLQPGDPIVIETRTGWFTYTVKELSIVAPTAVEVTYAVPGNPTATPTERLLTMTTCNPKYSARQRLIVRATLTAASAHDAGPPAVLTEQG